MALQSDNNRPIDTSVVLGINTNTGKDIIITDQERLRGIDVVGTTGTGKSTLLKSIALHAVTNGESLIYIDVDDRSIRDLLVRIPQERMKDVIYLDFSVEASKDIQSIDIIENSKILLIRLTKRRIDEIQLEELKHALFTRSFLPPHEQHIVTLICDECQMYLTPEFFEDVLSQGRRYGLSTVLATQSLVNFDDRLQAAIDQVGTHITFAVGRKDAEKLAPYYVKASPSEKLTRTFADMEKEKVIELIHLPDGMAYLTIRMRGDRFKPRMKTFALDEMHPRVRSL